MEIETIQADEKSVEQVIKEPEPVKVLVPIEKFVSKPRISPVKAVEDQKPLHAPQFKKNKTYKYCIYPGNYPAQLRNLMKARGNWTEVDQDNAIDDAQFIFRPVNFGPSVSIC